ncbi:dTDP-glucose 4,6-dehydratase [Sphingomonas canadensis]|uniref:dTDP-glucose 4,6-dehydratase n=1 Tax=Sphingomonas canadensis TaxID=1219257 RepID=A0ABW3HAP0_9SPHN|nr:dTDP-glucose 4,6-dehydratase [Sphingomonas canadensis]MCW3838190.1 dTDP-glucose 4,6-dehydratase [Sphingomonas canadensis]
MRILVTGGAGFIGSALVRFLVAEAGAEVLTVDRLTYAGHLPSLKALEGVPGHRLLRADICDADAMRQAFAAFRPDRVMHLAAESHVDRSVAAAGDFIQTNVVGTYTLLQAARGYWETLPEAGRRAFRFLHVSTDEVYGSLGPDGLFREDTPYDPSSPYSASKAASDHLAMAWHRTYGLPVVLSNCSNNYGPFQHPEKLIPLVILNAIAGKPLPVYGDGLNVRDWLYVEDHVRALDAIASRGVPGRAYAVGGRNERRNIDVVRRVCAILDRLRPDGAPHDRLIRHVADRPGHDARYAIDASRIESELDWRAREDFDSGIEKTVRWYLDNRWWWQPIRGGE